jgi:phage/plasmid-like protein (TIGR03299 family)
MAHELEMINGQAQMAYVNELPWHGLGTKVDPDLSPAEMMKAAGVDWRVQEVESFVQFNGKNIPTGQKALVRETDGRVLTQVGKNWHPVQNEEAFDFFAEFVERGQMQMHTAGSLKNGEIIWALAKVDDDFELFNGDKVESYMLFSNPHQYGKTIDIRFTPIRVVCNNTLTLSLQQQGQAAVRVNHRSAFDADAVKEMMGIAHFKMGQYKDMAQFLGSKRTTEETVKQYFGHLLGTSNKNEGELSRTAQRAMEVLVEQPGAEFAEGSWWTAFNAITYMTDHELGRSTDTRMQSAWYGANRKLKVNALELALEMAEAA